MPQENWTETKLEVGSRPKVHYEYYVTGRGEFPFDMLRYDACWPASGDDASRISQKYFGGPEYRNRPSIRLRSYHPPTVDRWRSFSWTVSKYDLKMNTPEATDA